ncbi:PadR family transcriptional regulator [Fructobacillus pseudoficulneus]|uniref:PadR family transcriptional regulator n=1 Tax=Fructobacillus pseudoficulneus TaxID=220714 RepID=A0A3F3GVV3_9LACO|nr:PadR family transcriptional regulator [Fructobacillus pseudoficulneus]GAP03425.1 PadR family transcriptional regulator [Fructobacillus pseudoficulneus]SEH46481.1 PadR family transcriptional regulator, regulatory protein PadR [Fructobacillus pseudoficulneus]
MAQFVSSQLLKGFLQGIMLSILSKKANYGYGIAVALNEVGLGQVPKGTIYPLLATMEKRGLLQSESRPSEDGPDRKYYFPTEEGMHAKEEFYSQWAMLEKTMNQMIEGD